ncbi:hypothetical protein Godav_013837, partial [Gossypium davidsonii]|nr:hypothetical protein [Gossypium davidsonii]
MLFSSREWQSKSRSMINNRTSPPRQLSTHLTRCQNQQLHPSRSLLDNLEPTSSKFPRTKY